MNGKQVTAVRTLDCAHKLRVRYLLPRPLDRELLESLGPGELRVQAFSLKVQGARDHLALIDEERNLRAAGVDGEGLLTVTFGKLGREAHEGVVADFESLLVQLLGVPIAPRE